MRITNMTLKELVVIAWGLQSFQVSAGPPWFDSTRYDIVATPEHRSSQPNYEFVDDSVSG